MKKGIIAIICSLFLLSFVAVPAMAGWGIVDVNGHYEANAPSYDYSHSTSIWGWGNDNAEAIASGNSGGTVDTHGIGLFFVKQSGDIDAFDISKTCTFSLDFGLKSISGAKAITNGNATAEGKVYGLSLGEVSNTAYVDGHVSQATNANEIGYPSGTFASAGEEASADFYAANDDHKCGILWVEETTSIHGGAITEGKSIAEVDPYGPHRSASAMTENMAKVSVCRPDTLRSSVSGSGGASALAANGSAFAGGEASFGYTGNTYGAGKAQVNANIFTGPNFSSVHVSGSSSATAH